MDKNVGGYDRAARLVVGAVLVLAGAVGYAGVFRVAVGPLPQALTSVVLVVLGLVLLATALTRRCVLNRVVGLNTYESGER
ncbi:MAG: YgaP family membrane protein [Halobacteriota archaeon]